MSIRKPLCAVLATVVLMAFVSLPQPVEAVPKCAVCTLLVGLITEKAIIDNSDVKTVATAICADVTEEIPIAKGICDLALGLFVPTVQACMSAGQSPDTCCTKSLGFCSAADGCVLFPTWPPKVPLAERHAPAHLIKGLESNHYNAIGSLLFPIIKTAAKAPVDSLHAKQLSEMLNAIGDTFGVSLSATPLHAGKTVTSVLGEQPHLPASDWDGDRYSTEETLRGSHWRGKDCDDINAEVYPGRRIDTVGPMYDHNCNGIYGVNEQGQSYEEMWCNTTTYRGLINLGDSATAHFRIPPEWLTAGLISNTTYDNLIPVIEDEADWPQCSWGTGHAPDDQCPPSPLGTHVDSLALRLQARNLCNHRDFQNIGVNGASTNNMIPTSGDGVITSMKARNGTDQPALVIFALVGNDVCGREHDFAHMTTPAQFETNVLASLAYLDTVLAPNSYLAFLGLIDGRVLYDTLQTEMHPIGTPYPVFYEYLNCLDTSPCWGWMNTNQTVRDLTYQRVVELNAVYSKIISEQKYNNFEMAYIPADISRIFNEWKSMGGQPKDLIEPVDGFHPSQPANELLAEQMWNWLAQNFTAAIGPVNPNNEAIIAQFGADLNGF